MNFEDFSLLYPTKEARQARFSGKDAPDIFLLAQKWLGESIQDTCVFEDSLLAIETAKKTGMQTVAIYDQYNFGQERMREIADHYIAKDETLMKLLEESHD